MFNFFKKDKPKATISTPEIMGLRLGASFEIDKLAIKLILDELVIGDFAATQIIQAVGKVDMDGTYLFRFYTDDEAWLQVICEGQPTAENVVDVKLFYYFDTLDIQNQAQWEKLLNQQIGTPTYTLDGHEYNRVWTSMGDYHNPVHIAEKTFDGKSQPSETDQFTMLFERELSDGTTESLFLSAEESLESSGNLSRCLVISTGITLSSSQITIHG
ncbi:hypothetical protein AN214_02015 [Pseudoalteromonas sp. P1-9]|uniref:YjfK family protein n=1 Tax=Pseudoalteromonas sp. P1-9 TaxID=1710354 RepID=UPI0006D5F2B5|nr:YjfK family protein [Pseudoalteromonas sp. P1-9]KPV95821.1 hypothetical protein AN214_02015 [Pseudoalteromonas sp. P1-9]